MSRRVAIIGAGLAGLALATRFAAPRFRGLEVELFDPRTHFAEDRTWCRFGDATRTFDRCRVHAWRSVAAVHRGRRVLARVSRGYELLSSRVVYAEALSAIAVAPNITLHTGCRTHAVHAGAHGLELDTDRGPRGFDLVFDSRPGAPSAARPVQVFHGLWVRANRPVFDPGVATLMDLQPGDEPGLRFFYVLPVAADRALVEDTRIGFGPAAISDPERGIQAYLRARHPHVRFEAYADESGRIAMHDGPQGGSVDPRHVPIGLRGGHVRAATGYAFDTIQRAADDLAEAVAEWAPGDAPWRAPAHPVRPFTRWMDEVFLHALAQAPQDAAGWFHAMFDRVDGDRLARFMTDRGGWLDRAAVMAALPPMPFVRAALARGRERPVEVVRA